VVSSVGETNITWHIQQSAQALIREGLKVWKFKLLQAGPTPNFGRKLDRTIYMNYPDQRPSELLGIHQKKKKIDPYSIL
jgi:hypothetical protein